MDNSVSADPLRNKAEPDSRTESFGQRAGRSRLITLMIVLSMIWLVALLIYFLSAPSLFFRLWPNEVGDLFAGWFAPLAMAWIAVAAFLQRDQLASHEEELKQNSEAIRLQAEELRRSIEEMERQNEHRNRESAHRDREVAATLIARLHERLMFVIERIARIGEGCMLRSPSALGTGMNVVEVLGEWRNYADWSRSNDVARSVETLGKGLEELAELIRNGWILDARLAVLRDLCTELHSLERITLHIERDIPSVGNQKTDLGAIEHFDTQSFRKRVADAYAELEAIEGELRKLDSPETST